MTISFCWRIWIWNRSVYNLGVCFCSDICFDFYKLLVWLFLFIKIHIHTHTVLLIVEAKVFLHYIYIHILRNLSTKNSELCTSTKQYCICGFYSIVLTLISLMHFKVVLLGWWCTLFVIICTAHKLYYVQNIRGIKLMWWGLCCNIVAHKTAIFCWQPHREYFSTVFSRWSFSITDHWPDSLWFPSGKTAQF